MQSVCEHLANQGYIVIAPDHTGNSPYAMIGMDPALDEISGDAHYREQMADVLPLLEAETAHRIQKEMALAFFDLTIRGDESRLELLRENPWGAYDTRVEILGF